MLLSGFWLSQIAVEGGAADAERYFGPMGLPSK